MSPHKAQWITGGVAAVSVVAVPLALSTLQERSGGCAPCWDVPTTAQWTRTVSGVLVGLAAIAIAATLLRWAPRRPAGAGGPFVLLAGVLLGAALAHWFEVLALWMPQHGLVNNAGYVTALTTAFTAVALWHALPRVWAEPPRQRVPTDAPPEAPAGSPPGLSASPTPPAGTAEAAGNAADAALEEARRASELRDTFLAMAAHELRTPLQSTLYWAELLRRQGANPALVADAAQHIIQNVLVQSRLVGDLLDISRILTGQLRMEWQPSDAVAVVRQAVDVVQTEARARSIHIELHAPDQPVPLLTDACRLEQVAWNLISNAVHASRDGSRVAVSLAATDQHVQLVVQDQGEGIAPHDLAHLFETFHQGEARAVRHGGLGLGLTITRNIVQQLGGQVTAHSNGVGLGATFTVDLPRQSATPGLADQGAAAPR